jgi:hypothetical protein
MAERARPHAALTDPLDTRILRTNPGRKPPILPSYARWPWVPADRFFGAAPDVLNTLKARVSANALELARHGVPKNPFYLTGQVGGKPFSVHAEGERVILTGVDGTRQEVQLTPPASTQSPGIPTAQAGKGAASTASEPVPDGVMTPDELPEPVCPQGIVAGSEGINEPPEAGTSPLDEGMRKVTEAFHSKEGGDQ